MPSKHEDLSLRPRNTCNAGTVAHIWNPSVPMARRQADGGFPDVHGPDNLAFREVNGYLVSLR